MLNIIMLIVIMLNVIILCFIVLNVIMLNYIMLSFIMLNVIMFNAIMLNVAAPWRDRNLPEKKIKRQNVFSLKQKKGKTALSYSPSNRFTPS